LGVGEGWSEKEGESEILARLPRASPSFCVQPHGTRRIREGKRERWPARVCLGRVCKGKRGKKRKEEGFGEFGQISFEF
jgi:hypothetical protein